MAAGAHTVVSWPRHGAGRGGGSGVSTLKTVHLPSRSRRSRTGAGAGPIPDRPTAAAPGRAADGRLAPRPPAPSRLMPPSAPARAFVADAGLQASGHREVAAVPSLLCRRCSLSRALHFASAGNHARGRQRAGPPRSPRHAVGVAARSRCSREQQPVSPSPRPELVRTGRIRGLVRAVWVTDEDAER